MKSRTRSLQPKDITPKIGKISTASKMPNLLRRIKMARTPGSKNTKVRADKGTKRIKEIKLVKPTEVKDGKGQCAGKFEVAETS